MGKKINVFEWFKYRTFYAQQFARTSELVKLKRQQRVSISLGIPTLNEEKTIGKVVRKLRRELMKEQPLLDEIAVIDSGSRDKTVKVAKKAGAQVFLAETVLDKKNIYRGKGENLWKSLHVLEGDIIVWLDADIKNIDKHMITGLLGPILTNKKIVFVKGFFQRVVKQGRKREPAYGGRTTEILVRPFVNLFFPELAGFVQPLSGQVAGRRKFFEKIPFYSGYGVEIGHLIAIEKKFGLNSMAQTYLGELTHKNQSLEGLGKQAFGILQVMGKLISGKPIKKMVRKNTQFVSPLLTGKQYSLIAEDNPENERKPLARNIRYKLRRIKRSVHGLLKKKQKRRFTGDKNK
ncbi:MAG: glucosyl-3-phosphoglycerate synthase [Candidatus Diapherotrites archaeon]|nr:glucosyl-3-phosphoglycerate synthase [Candidatus Diapherotrites archaeon]